MDIRAKREILRLIDYGVYVLTTKAGKDCFGSTITWVAQTSFKPSLVAVALKKDSGVYQGVRKSRRFALHMLRKDQKPIAASFFRASKGDGNTINGYPYKLSDRDIPILDDVAAYLECQVDEITEKGDHHIVIGEVVEAGIRDASSFLALSDTDWSYGG